jgi:RimJ/RimL family protein N-acetyltransferase
MEAPDIDVPTLETERLRLRPFRLGDFEDYAEMCGDPEVARYLSVRFTREQSWRHLAFVIGHWKLRGYGMWAVEHRSTGAFLGRIGFAHPEGWPGCELAWTLARRFWGCGYATEGARAALAHGFTVMNHECVLSLIQPENRASLRLAERLGESLRGRTELVGKEYLVYGIDRGELQWSQERVHVHREHPRPQSPTLELFAARRKR